MALATVRVLLTDDETGYLEVLAKRMRRRGYTVHTASSGQEAIRMLREREFDVAVVDLKMEDLDGLEVLRIMRMMAPHLEVVMLTGHGSDQSAQKGMVLGAFAYLTKPCELDTLLQAVQGAAERAARGRSDNRDNHVTGGTIANPPAGEE